MTRKMLRGLSLWMAAGAGALLGYGFGYIHYLEAVARARKWHPGAMICGNGFVELMVLAATGAMLLSLFLALLFWRSYERLPAAGPPP